MVLISTSRTALNHRCAALHGIAPPVGGLRHTRKQKSARARIPTVVLWNIRAKPRLRSLAPLRLHIFRRLVEMNVLVDMVDPSHRNEVVFAVGSITLCQLNLGFAIEMVDLADLLSVRRQTALDGPDDIDNLL
jgi:hypothetical protein